MLHVAGGTRQLKRRWRFLRAGKKLEKLYMLALSSSPQIVVVSKILRFLAAITKI